MCMYVWEIGIGRTFLILSSAVISRAKQLLQVEKDGLVSTTLG